MPTIQHEKVRVIDNDDDDSDCSMSVGVADHHNHSQHMNEDSVNMTAVKKRPDAGIIQWQRQLPNAKQQRGKKTFINEVLDQKRYMHGLGPGSYNVGTSDSALGSLS